jgi:hypothetical protein
MNPGERHEKGNVENKVGYHRRNLLVPMPRFISLADFNQQPLKMCEDDSNRDHYRHNETINELFAEDLRHCHPLPEIKFDLNGKKHVTTNNWGKFYLYKGMHEYSASQKHANTVVNLILTSSLVIVLLFISQPPFWNKLTLSYTFVKVDVCSSSISSTTFPGV